MLIRRLWITVVVALITLSTSSVNGQGPGAAPFPADGKVPGTHWNRVVNVAAAGRVIFGSGGSDRTPNGGVASGRNTLPDYWFHDMEHTPWDMEAFRTFLQFTLDPRALRNSSRPMFTPYIVRISANGREMNQWMAKQVLDNGGMGIAAPHIENAAQARNVVQATRYPQKEGAPDFEPQGQRGSGPGNAQQFLGMGDEEYGRIMDVWPLDPNGEVFNIILVENGEGVKNIKDIVRVPGVSSVMAATGDLGRFYVGDREKLERAVQTIVDACKEVKMICAIPAGPNDVERRLKQGFNMFLGSDEMIRIGHKLTGR